MRLRLFKAQVPAGAEARSCILPGKTLHMMRKLGGRPEENQEKIMYFRVLCESFPVPWPWFMKMRV